MRLRLLAFPLWLSLLAALAATAQTGRAFAVVPKTGPLANQTLYTNSHALLVGISKYADPRVPQLKYADQDALALRGTLIRSYGFPAENVTLLLDEQATRAGILQALSAFADEDRVKADDRVLFYFSGHGQTVSLPGSGEMGFLIPHDARVDLAKPQNRSGYFETCLDMETIWRTLRGSAAKHALVLADACYGGLLTQSRALGPQVPRPSAEVLASLLARSARQVLTAGDKGQQVEERPDLGHGAFTYHLLEELRVHAATPDQPLLTAELYASLKVGVGNDTAGKQNVQFGSYGGTQGEFVFLSTAPKPVPPFVRSAPEDPGTPLKAGQVRQNPKDRADMVWIPEGDFQMGIDYSELLADWKRLGWPDNWRGSQGDEGPMHRVHVSGFWLYRTEVTVAQYRRFCEATGREMRPQPKWSRDDHPVVKVSWADAKAYCDWAGARLPTEAEWERAARGPYTGIDGHPRRTFIWGDSMPKGRANVGNLADATYVKALGTSVASFPDYDDGYEKTSPVSSFAPTEWGLFDLAGNVEEYCTDWYDSDYYKRSPPVDPTGPAEGRRHVARGGDYSSLCFFERLHNRGPSGFEEEGWLDLGFRPARSR